MPGYGEGGYGRGAYGIGSVSGNALEGATLRAYSGDSTDQADLVETVNSDSSGNYTLTPLPADTYTVEASHPDYQTQTQYPVDVAAGADVVDIDFSLSTALATLTGTVQDYRTGSGVSSATITVYDQTDESVVAQTQSASGGGYTFSIPADDYDMYVEEPDHEPQYRQVSLTAGGTTTGFDFQLIPRVTLIDSWEYDDITTQWSNVAGNFETPSDFSTDGSRSMKHVGSGKGRVEDFENLHSEWPYQGQTIEVDTRVNISGDELQNFNSLRLWFGVQDDDNYLFTQCVQSSGTVEIWKRENGSPTRLDADFGPDPFEWAAGNTHRHEITWYPDKVIYTVRNVTTDQVISTVEATGLPNFAPEGGIAVDLLGDGEVQLSHFDNYVARNATQSADAQIGEFTDTFDRVGKKAVVSQSFADANRIWVGKQIRVGRVPNSVNYPDAMYTVEDIRTFSDNDDVRLHSDGLTRIGAAAGETGTVLSYAANPYIENRTDAENLSDYVEESDVVDASPYMGIAPNGGDLYLYTDDQADRFAAELGASKWLTAGYNDGGGAIDRFETSTLDMNLDSYPELPDYKNFDHVVEFVAGAAADIEVTGGASASLRSDIATEINNQTGSAYNASAVDDDTTTARLVNQLSANGTGIRIKQPFSARDNDANAIADAVVSVLETL